MGTDEKGRTLNRAERRVAGRRTGSSMSAAFRRPSARVRVHSFPTDPTRAQRPAKRRRLLEYLAVPPASGVRIGESGLLFPPDLDLSPEAQHRMSAFRKLIPR